MKKFQLLRFVEHLKNVKWMVIIFALFSLNNTFAQVSNTGTSSDGRFTLTKSANVSSVPSGGGEVTYTYTIKNNSNIRQYYVRGTDDKCSPIEYGSGLQSEFVLLSLTTVYYIPPGGTATWTCTEYISQTTTNQASFTFADGYASLVLFAWTGESTATANVTVVRETPPPGSGITECNTLWYGADEEFGSQGTVGTLSTSGAASSVFNIGVQTGGGTYQGTAAMAVDPSDPTLIYYIPRGLNRSNYGGLWVYDQSTGQSTLLTSPSATPDVVRLSVAPDGKVWTIDSNGALYYWTSSTGWVQKDSNVALSDGASWSSRNSGDLAFDGNGTMYIIASTGGTGYLYTISADELNGPNGAVDAELVGTMGSGHFNGIAFTEDGTLYATARDASNNDISYLYTVNIATGQATRIATIDDNYEVSDLGSCALPQSDIKLEKTSSATGVVQPGETITYTINACNIGTLTSTNTFLEDAVPSGTTYVPGSTKVNGTSISDVGGRMPFTTRRLINSPGSGSGRVAPGECAVVTFQVTVDANFSGTEICNQSILTYTGGGQVYSDDPNKPGGSDRTCNAYLNPVIGIVKTAPVTDITSPQDVTYTYEVTNQGTDVLVDVNVTDDRCSSPQYQSGDTNGDGKLQQDETWIYTCTSYITGTTTNTATVTGTGEITGAQVTEQDEWTVTTPANQATLAVNKTVSPTGEVNVGDTLSYTVEVTNTSSLDAVNVTLNDQLPECVDYVDGTAQKTFWVYQTVTPARQTSSVTKTISSNYGFNSTGSQTITLTQADFPSGSTDQQITGISFTVNGQTNSTALGCGLLGLGPCYGYQDQVSLSLSHTGMTSIEVDRGTDSDNNEFGTSNSGTWNTVSRSNVSRTGSALGDYTFNWYDSNNDNPNPDQTVTNVSLTVYYSYQPANTTQRVQTTNAAHAPETMVSTADGITLKPNETMTVTFDAVVTCAGAGILTNTAVADADNVFNPGMDTAENTVNNVVATNDTNQTNVNTPVSGSVTWNDYDPQGDSFTVTDINGTPVTGPTTITVSGVDENGNPVTDAGTITINPDGTYTYTPAPDFTGTVEVPYTITDENGATDTAVLVIDVTGPNTDGLYPPIAKDDTQVMEPGTPITFPILENDSDVDGTIDPTTVDLDPSSVPNGTGTDTDGDGDIDQVVVPGEGTWTVDNAGNVTFTPEAGFTGDPSPIDYTVADNDGLTDSATITITTGTPNVNEMSATDDGDFGYAGETFDGNVLNNDIDPDGSNGTPTVTAALADTDGDGLYDDVLTIGTPTTVYGTNENGEVVVAGTITLNADGSYTYESDPSFAGTTLVPYTVCDNDTLNACANATLQITTVDTGCLDINLWVYLEGSLVDDRGFGNVDDNLMRTTLNDLRLLPGQTFYDPYVTGETWYNPILGSEGQSYNIAPWNYSGPEGSLYNSNGSTDEIAAAAGYPATVTDWVLVSLRTDPYSGSSAICQQAALLHNDGRVEFVGNLCCDIDMTQSYYVVVEHRNHLIVMSHEAVSPVNGTLTYDFRHQQSWIEDYIGAGYVGQKQFTTTTGEVLYGMYGGNGDQSASANSDTDTNRNDLSQWEVDNNTIYRYKLGDYNMNGDVNRNDGLLWERNNNIGITSVIRE